MELTLTPFESVLSGERPFALRTTTAGSLLSGDKGTLLMGFWR